MSNRFKNISRHLVLAATLFSLALVGTAPTLAAPEKWEVLFDGKSTEKFRGFRQVGFPTSWTVADGTLKTIVGNGSDIMTRDQYDNFELQLEWKISAGGNSGVIYRATESGAEVWHTGPEMQVLDDNLHPDGKNPKTTAGSLYALIAATGKKLVPVGQWNKAKLIVNGNHVEHWLNGVKVVAYELNSERLRDLIAQSKFKDLPKFSKEPKGHIVLQHHHDEVAYRNIRIRKLTSK